MKITGVIVMVCAVMSLTQAALILTSEQKEKLANAKKECIQETSVDPEVLKKLLNGEFPDDSKFKDFLVCVAKKINFVNAAGEPQKDLITERLGGSINDPTKAKELVEKCLPKTSSSDAIYQFAKCVYESTPNRIIIVQ